jgi:hypothetical protein
VGLEKLRPWLTVRWCTAGRMIYHVVYALFSRVPHAPFGDYIFTRTRPQRNMLVCYRLCSVNFFY